MTLIPSSWGTDLREFNPCHAPAGSPDGGQFCSRTGAGRARQEAGMADTKDNERILPDGRTVRKYDIPEYRLGETLAKLQDLTKRAAKLGVPPPHFTAGNAYTKKWKDVTPDMREVDRVGVFVPVEVTVEPVKIPGWTLAAVLDHLPETGDTIIRTLPGFREQDIGEKWRKAANFCEHCKTARQRNSTYLLQPDGGGPLKQCGSTCLRDYTGHDAEDTVARASYVMSLFDSLRTLEDEDGMGGGGGRRNPYVPLSNYLGWVAKDTRERGFVSRKMCEERGGICSADAAADMMYRYARGMDRGDNRVEPPTEDDYKLANDAIDWVRGLESSGEKLNDFLWNLVATTRTDALHDRYLALAAASIPAYKRAMGLQAERKQAAATSTHVGTIGKRETFKKLTLTKLYGTEGYYGLRTLHRFVDPGGNVLVWWRSGGEAGEIGKVYNVKATPDKHDEFHGVKQTSLKRAVLEEVPAEVIAAQLTGMRGDPTRTLTRLYPLWLRAQRNGETAYAAALAKRLRAA